MNDTFSNRVGGKGNRMFLFTFDFSFCSTVVTIQYVFSFNHCSDLNTGHQENIGVVIIQN